MGWELRRGKLVYYRKVRDGKRVRSVYCGTGERGERAAREDEERRRAKLAPPAGVSCAAPEPVAPPAARAVEPPCTADAPVPPPALLPVSLPSPVPVPVPAPRPLRGVARDGVAGVVDP
jgi:hypothetical protein